MPELNTQTNSRQLIVRPNPSSRCLPTAGSKRLVAATGRKKGSKGKNQKFEMRKSGKDLLSLMTPAFVTCGLNRLMSCRFRRPASCSKP